MFKRALRGILLTTITVVAGAAWAKLPPPPVNQNIGMPDGHFSEMTSHTCLTCHDDKVSSPIGYRHHLRVNTPFELEFTAAPFPEKSPDGNHQCITCHIVNWVEDANHSQGGYLKFQEDPMSLLFRDCLNCHKQKTDEYGRLIATVHHLTDKAQKKLCYQCHGAVVDNATDDHRIPDPHNAPAPESSGHCQETTPGGGQDFYDISAITPWPGDNYIDGDLVSMLQAVFSDCPEFGRRYYDPNVLDGRFNIDPPRYQYEADAAGIIQAIRVPDGQTGGRRTGNCEHCHFYGDNPGDAVQPGTGLTKNHISTNARTHHATGIGQPGSGSLHSCDLCHLDSSFYDSIRSCEACHGINSLHAIQFDGEGDGIIPGQEKPFMGHIGNEIDCRGCHLNTRTEQVFLDGNFRFNGALSNISEISKATAVKGRATKISIMGSNLEGPGTRLELRGTNGKMTGIELIENSSASAKAIIPANLATGSYFFSVAKGYDRAYPLHSPPKSFLVTPDIHISNVSCDKDRITITGGGFGGTYIKGSSHLGVSSNGGSCSIDFWSDTQIIANCGTDINTVIVDTLFGKTSSAATCKSASNAEQPKWWAIWPWWSSWSWSRR